MGVEFGEKAGEGFNQAAMRQENKRYVLNENGNVDWGSINELTADDGTTIKKAPVRMQIGYQVGEGDAGAGYIHIKNRHNGFLKNKGYKSISEAVYDILDNADFIVKSTTGDGRDRVALIKDLTPHTSILLALDYTIRHPEQISSLILVGAQYKVPTRLIDFQNLIFRCMPEKTFADMGLSKHDTIKLSHSMRMLDFSSKLSKLHCPVSVICGKKDRANLKAAKQLHALLPQSHLHIIPDAGHEVNKDAPKALAALIENCI